MYVFVCAVIGILNPRSARNRPKIFLCLFIYQKKNCSDRKFSTQTTFEHIKNVCQNPWDEGGVHLLIQVVIVATYLDTETKRYAKMRLHVDT